MAVSKKIQLFELQLYCYQAAKMELNRFPGDGDESFPFIDGMTVKQVREWIDNKIETYRVLIACALQIREPKP